MPLEPSRHHPHDSADLASHRSESLYSTMPANSQSSRTQVVTNPPPSSSKKRQRDVDWNDFYKNGLPTEIIVIDDSPEPEEPATSKNLTNGHSYASGPTDASVAPPAKRRRKETDAAPYDPVHHIASHTHTPRQYGSPSKSTTSSGRTNSANHTTAATSLGSLSSNGQYDHELQQASQGQKRKRTRAQTNSEAKRREALVTDAFASYIPPRQPIKKSRDVPVQIITDVSHFHHGVIVNSYTNTNASLRTCRPRGSTMTKVTTLLCRTIP